MKFKKPGKFARISDYIDGVSDFVISHCVEEDANMLFATAYEKAYITTWKKHGRPDLWVLRRQSIKHGSGYMLFAEIAYGRYRLVVWRLGSVVSDTKFGYEGGISNCGEWFVATEFYGKFAGIFKRTAGLWW